MIVFAGICPTSPLLLDRINKQHVHKAEETLSALNEFADELYATHPEVIVLISEHPTQYETAFSINIQNIYKFDLTDFGDLGFEKIVHPDIELIDRLQRNLRKQQQPISLTTDNALHFSSAIPLHFIAKNLKNYRIIPIAHSSLGKKEHFAFGNALKEVFMHSNKRIAVIAAGDLANTLTDASPAGFAKEGAIFDKQFVEAVNTKSSTSLLKITDETREKAQQTIYEQALILFGILDRIQTKTHVHAYEAPFGVGFLTAHFIIK